MARKPSKRYQAAAKLVDAAKSYPVGDAVKILKQMPKGKSDETVDLAFKLGVDPKQSDQMVRGTVALPNGSGKNVRVLVFAKGDAAEKAKAAGADIVGFEDLIKRVTEGFQDFDVAVATPDAMGEVRKLGKILGPRGLMPNPRTGTVTEDTAKAVKECKAGRVEFKLDKSGNVHVVVGKVSFEGTALEANAKAVIEAVVKARPSTAKGKFVETAVLASTYSPGVRVDVSSFITN
jgi:large subunit ribosomal protein L1